MHVSRKHRLKNVDNEVNQADDEMDIDFNGNDEFASVFGHVVSSATSLIDEHMKLFRLTIKEKLQERILPKNTS